MNVQILVIAGLAALAVLFLAERFKKPAVEVLRGGPEYSDPIAGVANLLDESVKYQRADRWLRTGVKALADADTETIARGYSQAVALPSPDPIEPIPLAAKRASAKRK